MDISTRKKVFGLIAEVGAAGYFAVREVKGLVMSGKALFELHNQPLPKPLPPQFCPLLRGWRTHSAKFAVVYGTCGAALRYGAAPLIIDKEFLFFSGVHLVFIGIILNIERRFCNSPDDDNQKKQDDDVGVAIAERLRQLVAEWQPTARVSHGSAVDPVLTRSYRSYWQAVAPHDYAEESDIGTALTFLVALGGIAAVGAASALSWSAESAMKAASGIPAFGY